MAKRLEMRLSVSPATPFSDASLPNHTKMFELVHMVISMEDFGPYMGNIQYSIFTEKFGKKSLRT